MGSTPGLSSVVEARRQMRKHLKSAVHLKNQNFGQLSAESLGVFQQQPLATHTQSTTSNSAVREVEQTLKSEMRKKRQRHARVPTAKPFHTT
mmetsp:Transcript_45154/g.59878  ORF Transcript_45154/g.59878 Transcript_45154/m.59878 type:complete len:92 (-) Transcript_45154:1343-1618(-)